jgi:lipoate-protein ligase A
MVTVDYMELTDSPAYIYAVRDALLDVIDNYIVVGKADSSDFIMPNQTLSSVLDVNRARTDGYGVARFRHANASEYSVMMFAPEILLVGITFDAEGKSKEIGFDVLKALRDAINDAGLNAHIDESSTQGNDVVINGKKVGAYTIDEYHGYYAVGFFVALDFDYQMAEYVDLPDEKFDGKFADTIDQRVAGLHEFNPELTNDDVVTYLDQRLKDNTSITGYNERSIPDSIHDTAQQIETEMRSDDEVFKR